MGGWPGEGHHVLLEERIQAVGSPPQKGPGGGGGVQVMGGRRGDVGMEGVGSPCVVMVR